MRIAHVVVMAALLAGFSAGPAAAQAPLAAAPTAGFETKRPVADARDCIAIVFGAIAREGQDVHWMGNSPQPMLWVTDNHTLLASVRVEETPEVRAWSTAPNDSRRPGNSNRHC